MGKMIVVEGYKAFRGVLIVWQRVNGYLCEPKEIYGEWLYKPETKCWYGGGKSYPADVCDISIVE